MLPGKVELHISIWTSGTQDQFVMHVQQAISAISAIRRKGLKDNYERLLRTDKEHQTKLQDANLQVEFAPEGQDKAHLVQAAKTTATAFENAKAEMASVAEQVFQLYSTLITEKARQPWTNVVQER